MAVGRTLKIIENLMVFQWFLGVWGRRGAVLGRSCGGLVGSWGGLGASWDVLVRSWCGLGAILRGLGASSGGLGAILARLEGQKMARRRFEDLRRTARECEQRGATASGTQFLMIISFF